MRNEPAMSENPNATRSPPSEAEILAFVRAFYGRAREDDLIGPIFNANVGDWDAHIANIGDFWSSLMLRTGRYGGQPLRAHLPLPLEGGHFDRWLALFETTAQAHFAPDVAEAFIAKARRIADSFEMAKGTQKGEIRAPRHSRS
jgi:hemoglobin